MIKAFTGKTYTAARENLWRKMDFKGYNTIAEYSESNRITKQKTGFLPIDDWPEKLLLGVFESDSTTIHDPDLEELITSWTIDPDTDFYYQLLGGAKIYGKRNLTTDIPHLKFVSGSSRYVLSTALTGETITEFSIYFYITPLVVDKEQYILCREGTFSININAANHIVFTVWDYLGGMVSTTEGTVAANTQYRVVCTYAVGGNITVAVNEAKTTGGAGEENIGSNSNDLYVGCKAVGETLSNYLDACIHTLAIYTGILTDEQVTLIDDSIDPVGLETIKYTYDDAVGTVTGIPNALKKIEQKFPYFETVKILEKDTTGKIEESDA